MESGVHDPNHWQTKRHHDGNPTSPRTDNGNPHTHVGLPNMVDRSRTHTAANGTNIQLASKEYKWITEMDPHTRTLRSKTPPLQSFLDQMSRAYGIRTLLAHDSHPCKRPLLDAIGNSPLASQTRASQNYTTPPTLYNQRRPRDTPDEPPTSHPPSSQTKTKRRRARHTRNG